MSRSGTLDNVSCSAGASAPAASRSRSAAAPAPAVRSAFRASAFRVRKRPLRHLHRVVERDRHGRIVATGGHRRGGRARCRGAEDDDRRALTKAAHCCRRSRPGCRTPPRCRRSWAARRTCRCPCSRRARPTASGIESALMFGLSNSQTQILCSLSTVPACPLYSTVTLSFPPWRWCPGPVRPRRHPP